MRLSNATKERAIELETALAALDLPPGLGGLYEGVAAGWASRLPLDEDPRNTLDRSLAKLSHRGRRASSGRPDGFLAEWSLRAKATVILALAAAVPFILVTATVTGRAVVILLFLAIVVARTAWVERSVQRGKVR